MSNQSTLWLQSSSGQADAALWSVYQESAKRHANRVVRPGLKVEFHAISETYPGVDYLDSGLHLVSREVARNGILAEQRGYAAFVNVSTNDSGRAEIHEMTDIPAVFITECAVHLAAQMGAHFGFLTHNSGSRKKMELMTQRYGLGDMLVEGASLEMGYSDFSRLYQDPATGIDAFRKAAREVIARGANVLIPAGGPLNMFFVDHELRHVDGVPLIDILAIVIKSAERAVDLQALGVLQRGSTMVSADFKAKLRDIFLR
ncbi:MAG: aspartate/glutamate racemase family protein [Alcaligenaceae bacterium]